MSPKVELVVELVREWLMLADDDLRLAELAMKDSEPGLLGSSISLSAGGGKIAQGVSGLSRTSH